MQVKSGKVILRILIFMIGFLICIYPVVSNQIEKGRHTKIIETYQRNTKKAQEQEVEELLYQAELYNEALYQGQVTDSFLPYNSQLRSEKLGIMGVIEIPKIEVCLPIYHGTEKEVLENGAGHFRGSSLPIGGINTHSIITGHRGLPNAKLFTRLDEMEMQDYFYIEVCNRKLAYQICDRQVILPEEVEKLKIQDGEDLISLITCTPYGINTHRLVLTGKRVPYVEEEKMMQKAGMMSAREITFIVLPIVMLIIALVRVHHERRRRMETKIKKRKRKRWAKAVGLSICLLLIGVFGMSVSASGGSVEIQLKKGGVVSYAKVGEYEDGKFVLTEPYQESKVELAELQYAKEKQKAAEELLKYVKEDGQVVTDEDGTGRLEDMEEGVYLFYTKETVQETILPSLITIPTWDAEEKMMSYTISLTPKYTSKKITTKTGDNHSIEIYAGIAMISLIIIAFVSCHRRFKCGTINDNILTKGGCTHGNDNDTKNPRCTRRFRQRSSRTVNRSKVRRRDGK